MADTWDEAACRARLVAADQPHDIVACRELDRHAAADLEAALAALDAARAECDRLRAALRPFAAVAARPEVRDWSGGCGLVVYGLGTPNLDDCRRAAAALGAARD
jgi:hypothetical protein